MIRNLFGKGLFKTIGIVGGLALIVYVGLKYPAVLSKTGDMNLWIVRNSTKLIPGEWGGVVENFFRFGMGADKLLLMAEAAGLIKIALYPFAMLCRTLFGKRNGSVKV